jgi:hypothetical protein
MKGNERWTVIKKNDAPFVGILCGGFISKNPEHGAGSVTHTDQVPPFFRP